MTATTTNFDEGLRLLSVMSEFRRIWPSAPIHIVELFIAIGTADAQRETLSITEAGERVVMSLAATSRNIGLLETKIAERGMAPLGLVEVKPHPSDSRRRLVQLSPKGRTFFARLCSFVRS